MQPVTQTIRIECVGRDNPTHNYYKERKKRMKKTNNMRKATVKRIIRMGKGVFVRNDYRRIVSTATADGYSTPKAAANRPRLTAAEKRKAAERAAYLEWYSSPEQWLMRYTRKLAGAKVRKINQSAGLALSIADVDDLQAIMMESFWTWYESEYAAASPNMYADMWAYVDAQRTYADGEPNAWGMLYNGIGRHCYDGVKEYISKFRKDTGIDGHCYRLDESRDGEIVDESRRIDRIIAGKELPDGSTPEAANYLATLKNNLTAVQRRILGGLAAGNLREIIMENCGISKATYYREMKKIVQVAEKLDNDGVLNRYRRITAKQRNNRNVQLKTYIARIDANLTKEEAGEVEDYLKAIRWNADSTRKTNKPKA